jgi:hypothetical protein
MSDVPDTARHARDLGTVALRARIDVPAVLSD